MDRIPSRGCRPFGRIDWLGELAPSASCLVWHAAITFRQQQPQTAHSVRTTPYRPWELLQRTGDV